MPQPGGERPEYYLALLAGDLAAIVLCLALAAAIRYQAGRWLPFLPPFDLHLVAASLLSYFWIFIPIPLSLAYRRTYQRRLPYWEEVRELIIALATGFIFVFALVSMGKLSEQISRLYLAVAFSLSVLAVPLVRYVIKLSLFSLPPFRRKAVVLGADGVGEELVRGLESEPYLGYEVIGFLDDAADKHGKRIAGKKVFGAVEAVGKFVALLGVDSVFIAAPSFSQKRISEISARLQGLVREVALVPEFREIGMLNAELSCLISQKLLLIRMRNNLRSAWNRFVKRTFDLTASCILFPLVLPLCLLIALAIRMESKGSPIFVQRRLGQGGKIFSLFKFRTMYADSDRILEELFRQDKEAEREWKTYKKLRRYDPRVTKIGHFLRKTSLDELPQLLNVLRGEMSLIGPRPYLPEERADMGDYAPIILLARPGMSGLWQVSGRSRLSFEDRLKMDAWYVLNWALWLDVTLLFRTFRAVLKREGSC